MNMATPPANHNKPTAFLLWCAIHFWWDDKHNSTLSRKKGCLRHQAVTLQLSSQWAPGRTQDADQGNCQVHSSSQPLEPPWQCTQRKLRMWENRGYWFQVAGVHNQGMTSEPRLLLLLPIHRKSSKFLNSRYLVSVINCHLLMFRLDFCLKKPTISWLSDMPRNSFLNVIWRCCLPVWMS